MAEHPGYWLTQTRLNVEQSILSGRDLFMLPDLKGLDVALLAQDPLDQVVYAHFYAGSYSFWAAAVDFEAGIFTGYSRNRLTGPVGRWGQISHETMRGIRIPLKVEGQLSRIPLQRDTRFRPQLLREALREEIYG